MPNITTNHAITYTNNWYPLFGLCLDSLKFSFLFQIRKQADYSHPVLRDQAGQTSQPNFQSGEQNAGYATISNSGSSKYDKRAELLIKSPVSYYPIPSWLFMENLQ